jgi:hypothetical protein
MEATVEGDPVRDIRSFRMARAGLVTLLLLGVSVAPAFAQWPTVLLFSGGTLKTPVLVSGADSVAFAEIFRPTAPGGSRLTIEQMTDRPFIDVACFWGPVSNPALNGTPLADLKPEMAWQRGRFFPATATESAAMFVAVMVKGRSGSIVPPSSSSFRQGGLLSAPALDVLKRLGVPIGPPDSRARGR